MDLTTQENVKQLMESSQTEKQWYENCALVKKANNNKYPDFWFDLVIRSGLAIKVYSQFK